MKGKNVLISLNNSNRKEKILLILPPFWDPLIPPLGLASLKTILEKHGYEVKTVDFNTREKFREIYLQYFAMLKELIPEEFRGNINNIGHAVLHDQILAKIHSKSENLYRDFVKVRVYRTFYYEIINDEQVEMLDVIINNFLNNLKKDVLDLVEQENPTVVGTTLTRDTLPASLIALKLIKENYPNKKTIVGGGLFSDRLTKNSKSFKIFLKRASYIDKVFIGEGELLLLEYLKGHLPEHKRVYTLDDINVGYFDINSGYIPDFSDFEISKYPYMATYTSRSCPFQCKFCNEAAFWGKFRKRKTKVIYGEMVELYKKYGTQLFLMGDALINSVITGLSKKFLESNFSIYWDGFLRVTENSCDFKKTLLWRRGGLYRVRLGVESGSPQILKSMNKDITVDQIRRTLKNLAMAGVKTTTFWIVGYPGETEEDFQMTLNLIEELKDYIYEAEYNPFICYPESMVGSGAFQRKYNLFPIFENKYKDLIVIPTWEFSCKPDREEKIRRGYRFANHCKKLGIPNTYSLKDTYAADKRWIKLHDNAVPPLLRFKDVNVEECKSVKGIKEMLI